MDKTKLIYSGNAIVDGNGGWFMGNRQAIDSLRHRKSVLVKYGIHQAGQECRDPWKEQADKVTLCVLIEGGPFVHWFRTDADKDQSSFSDGSAEDVRVLEKVGDYLVYEPKALHSWKALRESVVLTVQFPTEDIFQKLLTL